MMGDKSQKYNVLILLIKCYLIILTLGLIFPKIIEILIKELIYKFNNKNSTFVFNFLNYNDMILNRYLYILYKFFDL